MTITCEVVQPVVPPEHRELPPDLRGRPNLPPRPVLLPEVPSDVCAPDGDRPVVGEGLAQRTGDGAGGDILRVGGKQKKPCGLQTVDLLLF